MIQEIATTKVSFSTGTLALPLLLTTISRN
jgi:hypothetical protein